MLPEKQTLRWRLASRSLIREWLQHQHVWKMREEGRTVQRQRLSCDAVPQEESTSPTGSSGFVVAKNLKVILLRTEKGILLNNGNQFICKWTNDGWDFYLLP